MYEIVDEMKSQIRSAFTEPKKELYIFAGEKGYWIYNGNSYRYAYNLGDVVDHIKRQKEGIELIVDRLPEGISEENDAGMELLHNSEIRCLKDCLT
jgi:hypothetical protein